jgi:sarcosine oxidase
MHAPDLIVIGLGVAGAATALAAARRGAKVLGLDRFHPPHAHGSSHGRSRITRVAVGEGDRFVALASRSHALWRQLEAETGERIFDACGFLLLVSPAAERQRFHGTAGWLDITADLAARHRIPVERLDAPALRERFPAFRVGEGTRGSFEPGGGRLFAETALRAMLARAAALGARCAFGDTVHAVEAMPGGGVRVHSTSGVHEAARAVLAAGPWLPSMLGEGGAAALESPVRPALTVWRQSVHWFGIEGDPRHFAPERFPPFVWLTSPEEHPALPSTLYGFPAGDGEDGAVKVSVERSDDLVAGDAPALAVQPAESAAVHEHHLRHRIEGLGATVRAAVACRYTCTPDANFIAAPHPALPGLVVLSACSGHGFKHAAALGEAVVAPWFGAPPGAATDLAAFGWPGAS